MAYEHMEGQLRQNLSRPNEDTTVESLIKELNTLKHIWFDIYGKNASRPPYNRQGNEYQGEQGQQAGRPSRFGPSPGVSHQHNGYPTNPYRQNVQYQSNNPYHPFVTNTSAYAAGYPFRPWRGQYQQGQNQTNRYPDTNQNNVSRLEGFNRRPLQITAGDSRNTPSQSDIANQQPRSTGTPLGQQNRPWQNRSYGRQPFASTNTPAVRDYHREATDETAPEQQPYDDHQNYEAYEEQFYENAYRTGPDRDQEQGQ